MTPPCHPLTYFGPSAAGVKIPKCLCWIIFEAGFEDFIIMEIVGNCLGHIFVDEVNNCLEDFGFFKVWELSGIFKMEELEICFFAFAIDSPSCLRICADGLYRSSNRRIQLPRFRPTSKSLFCMFR